MIKVNLIDGGRKIQLLEDLPVKGLLDFVVPKDFICDYASVPRVLWSLIPPMGNRYTRAAILHDYMYATHYVYVLDKTLNVGGWMEVNRKTADVYFKEALIAAKVRKWRVTVMYRAVRLFGAKAWKRELTHNKP